MEARAARLIGGTGGRRRVTALAAVLAVAWMSPAHGEGEQASNYFGMSLEELLRVEVAEVTTASKRAEKTTEAPGTVIVVDKRDIRLRGYATLQDVLRDLPGMETIEYYFSEIGTLVPVRGVVGNNKIVVLVNGVRVNPPGGELFPIRNDISVRNAEQIEVVYGPGSTLYGQDAICAVINIKTQQPARSGLDAGGSGGMNESGEGWATFGEIYDQGRVRFSGHVRVADSDLTDLENDYSDWWAGYEDVASSKGSGTDPVRSDYGFNAFARVETDETSLQVWHRQSRRSSSEGFTPILGYVSEAVWEDMTTVIEGGHTLSLSENADLKSALSYSRYEIDPDSRYVYPSSDTNWFLDDFKYGIGSECSIEETVDARLGKSVHLLAGAVASAFVVTPKATIPGGADTDEDLSSQGGSFVYYTESGNEATRHEIQRVVTARYGTYAAYAEGSWQMTDTLKSIAGARITEDERFDENPLTPRGSLVWDAMPRLTVKYTYAEAYVAPSPYFAYSPFDNGTLLCESNPDLEPEESLSHEVAFQYALANGTIGLSTYYGEQENLIIVADAGSEVNTVLETVYMEDGTTRKLVHTANGGESRSVGADLYGKFHFGSVSPWGSYSVVDYEEEIEDETMNLRGVSAHNVRLGATWAVTPKFFVTPSFVIRSRPQGVDAGELDEELDTPWEMNLHANYKLSRRVEIFTTVRNVTDHKYALGGFTGDAVPQETFRGIVGLRAEI